MALGVLRASTTVGALLSLAPSSAMGQLTASGGIIGPTPLPDELGHVASIALYEERQGVMLTSDLATTFSVPPAEGMYDTWPPVQEDLPADSVVSCYLLHYQSADGARVTGSLTVEPGFELVGIAARDIHLGDSDDVCRPVDWTSTYPTDMGRGGLGGVVGDDLLVVRDGGAVLDITLSAAPDLVDQMRVFVARLATADAGTPPATDAGPLPLEDAGTTGRLDAGATGPADAGTARAPLPAWDYRGSGGCTCIAGGRSPAPQRAGLLALGVAVIALAWRITTRAGGG